MDKGVWRREKKKMSYIKFGKYELQQEFIISDQENGNSMKHIYKFSNGYGASVIQSEYSYGHKDGLYELAVLKDGELCYSTPITGDIIGYLTADEVAEHLSRIERLPDIKEE